MLVGVQKVSQVHSSFDLLGAKNKNKQFLLQILHQINITG
jgi:hypothetical protein